MSKKDLQVQILQEIKVLRSYQDEFKNANESLIDELLEKINEHIDILRTYLELYYCDICPANDMNMNKYHSAWHYLGYAKKEDYYCKYHTKLEHLINDLSSMAKKTNIKYIILLFYHKLNILENSLF